MTAPNLVASSGSPITPVDARNTSAGLQPAAWAAMLAVSLVAARPDLPVKALALPELTTRARAAPPLRRAAPIDRGGRTSRLCEDAGDCRALLEQRQQHVGASGMPDAGGRGRKFDTRHRRHVGKAGGRERGEGGCHGLVLRHGRSESQGDGTRNHRLWNMSDKNCEKRNSAAQFFFCSSALSSRSTLALWRSLAMKSDCALRAK